MYGITMGTLKVTIRDTALRQTLGTIWTKSGNQGLCQIKLKLDIKTKFMREIIK